MADRYGPNDLMPCGTDPARRRHLARGEVCDTCRTTRRPPDTNQQTDGGVER